MRSWHNYHSTALVLGTLLPTIDCVYLQAPGGNLSLAELKASELKQWCILYPTTSIVFAVSTTRCFGSHVGWLHSWDNLRSTQFGLRYMGSERWKRCMMQKQSLESWTFFTMSSVRNGSNRLVQLRVRVGKWTELLQRFLPHENPDRCNFAGFTTKNLAFQPHNFGCH